MAQKPPPNADNKDFTTRLGRLAAQTKQTQLHYQRMITMIVIAAVFATGSTYLVTKSNAYQNGFAAGKAQNAKEAEDAKAMLVRALNTAEKLAKENDRLNLLLKGQPTKQPAPAKYSHPFSTPTP